MHLSLQWGTTALMKASEEGKVEWVKLLLDAGVQVNVQDKVNAVLIKLQVRVPPIIKIATQSHTRYYIFCSFESKVFNDVTTIYSRSLFPNTYRALWQNSQSKKDSMYLGIKNMFVAAGM